MILTGDFFDLKVAKATPYSFSSVLYQRPITASFYSLIGLPNNHFYPDEGKRLLGLTVVTLEGLGG